MTHDQEDEYVEEATGSRLIPATVLFVAVVGFLSLGWYAYQAGSSSVSDEDLLVVEAENTPMKEAPLDPGGMQFPHQDKSIYETIASNSGAVEKPTEKVLAEAEQPMIDTAATPPAAVPAETLSPAVVAAETSVQAAAPVIPPPSITPQPQVETVVLPAPVAAVVAAPEPKKQAPKPADKKVEKPAATAKSGSGTVQLGAFKSESEAESAWKKLSGKPALKGKKPVIQRADLGDKGVFYRLRVSGVDPKSTCAALGSVCMAVK